MSLPLGSKVDNLIYHFAASPEPRWLDNALPEDTWIEASPHSVRELFAIDPRLRRRFLRFLRSGCIGYFLVRRGEWISYAWSTRPGRGRPPHMPRLVSEMGAYWLFYTHTREAYRCRGLQKQLVTRLLARIHAEQTIPLILCDILPENVPSRYGAMQLGFSPFGVLTTYQFWIPKVGGIVIGGEWRRDQPHPPLEVNENAFAR